MKSKGKLLRVNVDMPLFLEKHKTYPQGVGQTTLETSHSEVFLCRFMIGIQTFTSGKEYMCKVPKHSLVRHVYGNIHVEVQLI